MESWTKNVEIIFPTPIIKRNDLNLVSVYWTLKTGTVKSQQTSEEMIVASSGMQDVK